MAKTGHRKFLGINLIFVCKRPKIEKFFILKRSKNVLGAAITAPGDTNLSDATVRCTLILTCKLNSLGCSVTAPCWILSGVTRGVGARGQGILTAPPPKKFCRSKD